MNQILAMREKRANLWDAAKAFLDTHRGADGMLSAEDAQTYDKMENDVVNLGKEIERLERQRSIEDELNAAVGSPIKNAPVAQNAEEKKGRASDEYKKNFWNAMRSKAPHYDVVNALQVGTDSEGGYLVPDEYEKTLVEALEEENIFRKLAHAIRTSSGERKIPVVASHGIASWTDEEQAYHEADDAFSITSLSAHKLTTMIKVSEELLNDSVFNMQQYIAKEFARRIGAAEEDAFFNGTGTGMPTGILKSADAGLPLAKGVTAITADDIIDLFYSLKAPYRRKAVFVMNDGIVKAIRKLKTTAGEYLWQPALTAGTPDMLLGRPVYTSSCMPTAIKSDATMTVEPIMFGDLSYYWIADRQGRSFKRLNELYATTGQVGFLASQRVDGKLILPEAVKVARIAKNV